MSLESAHSSSEEVGDGTGAAVTGDGGAVSGKTGAAVLKEVGAVGGAKGAVAVVGTVGGAMDGGSTGAAVLPEVGGLEIGPPVAAAGPLLPALQ